MLKAGSSSSAANNFRNASCQTFSTRSPFTTKPSTKASRIKHEVAQEEIKGIQVNNIEDVVHCRPTNAETACSSIKILTPSVNSCIQHRRVIFPTTLGNMI